ncbi:MAG: hypothetical protein ACKOCM_11890 [Cyanobacteriota bacterium]
MARPRWHAPAPTERSPLSLAWDRFVALWALLNLLWVAFDLSYIPLRTFWLQRNLYPLPSLPLVVPLQAIPDITPWVDPIKGISPHRETSAWLAQFQRLDQSLNSHSPGSVTTPELMQGIEAQRRLTLALIETNPFQNPGTLEKIKERLRERANRDSAKDATNTLLSSPWLLRHGWARERSFWHHQVLPLVVSNYARSSDDNGRPTDHAWRLDLLVFQSVFALDILLRVIRLKRRLPGLRWRDAVLRRWVDLPLLLPFWRLLRLLPVTERLHTSGLISIEPLRAVISRAVVALLAVELFEVLALQLIDGSQQLIRSPQWPERIRSLCSHQSVRGSSSRLSDGELSELLRIWAPLLLDRVAPRLAPELQGAMGHALQQSLEAVVLPPPLRPMAPLLRVDDGLSRQLAAGVVNNLLALGRNTSDRLGQRDQRQLELLQLCIDRFWEELAMALDQGPALQRSQDLLCRLLELVKTRYLGQINRESISDLIQELDALTTGLAQEPAAGLEQEPG